VEPTPTETIVETPAPPEGEIVSPNISGNSYISPAFGYGLTWSDAWQVSDEESDARGDYLGLEHPDGIFADLIGEPFPADAGNCFDFIVSYYSDHEDYTSVNGAVDQVSAAPGLWDYTGTITATTESSSGSSLDLVNFVACSHIPGQSAIVSLEQVVEPETFDQLKPEMDALRQGFALSATGQPTTPSIESTPTTPSLEATQTPMAVGTESASATVVATESAGTETAGSAVVGSTYTSPSYGYTLTWDETWTVDQESTEGGQDFLGLTNGPVLAELLSEEWDPSSGNCFEWIVDFYATNAEYADVRASQDAVSAAPGIWEVTGAIAMTNADGTEEHINYVACSPLPGQDVIVSLEQFVLPIDAPGQLAAMDALREGFSNS
jgi:hypothetical protein